MGGRGGPCAGDLDVEGRRAPVASPAAAGRQVGDPGARADSKPRRRRADRETAGPAGARRASARSGARRATADDERDPDRFRLHRGVRRISLAGRLSDSRQRAAPAAPTRVRGHRQRDRRGSVRRAGERGDADRARRRHRRSADAEPREMGSRLHRDRLQHADVHRSRRGAAAAARSDGSAWRPGSSRGFRDWLA